MGPWHLNIQLWRMLAGPMAVEYSTLEDVQWAHGTLIFNHRGCWPDPWGFNMQLLSMSIGLIGG